MSTGRDDDALSWGGDEDPTLDVGKAQPAPPAPPALPDGFRAVGKGSEAVGAEQTDDAVATVDADAASDTTLGNAAFVSLGILVGVYVLFTIGWVIGGLRLQGVAAFLVDPIAFVPFLWLAILAPALWFGVAWVLTRRSATWIRFVWLIAGAVLFVPWPFIMIGAVGQ